MKKYLIPETGKFYKANLHCHSTVSDGSLTPEELKKAYMEQGYSIIAYTDHNVLIPHPELADENFLPLNGYEMDITPPSDGSPSTKTCHFCLIALEPDNLTQVCYHRSEYLRSNAVNYRSKVKFDESAEDYERIYSGEKISEMMKMGHDNGFFITYNHPGWSLETYNEYINYHHMHAMEICNFGCVVAGYPDYNEKEYDEMLRSGKRIYCIATDDNHNRHAYPSKHCDSFGGFTMIKAEKLEYRTITQALEDGSFYASQGPQIHSLWFEDGKIRITCSDADRIIMNTGRRLAKSEYSQTGKPLNEASFEVLPEDLYVRLTVIDKAGYPANTNAYFTDQLFF